MNIRTLTLPSAILIVLFFPACHRAQTPAVKRYPFTGRVVVLDPSSQSAIIAGDAIPGFMDAMAMTYRIKDASEFKQVSSGDSISAEVVVQPKAGSSGSSEDEVSDYWLEKVRVTAHAKQEPAKPSSSVHMPTPGKLVPDFAFTNQDGRRISLAQYRGKTLLVTFIYTRCPFEDYCPRVSHEFASAYQLVEHDPTQKNVHLLSLSFDPAHDTPKVLRDYAFLLAGSKDPALFRRWEFATAQPADLRKLADFFAFTYQEENGQITHSLSTTVIGPDGKVISWRHDNTWHAADLLKDATSS